RGEHRLAHRGAHPQGGRQGLDLARGARGSRATRARSMGEPRRARAQRKERARRSARTGRVIEERMRALWALLSEERAMLGERPRGDRAPSWCREWEPFLRGVDDATLERCELDPMSIADLDAAPASLRALAREARIRSEVRMAPATVTGEPLRRARP